MTYQKQAPLKGTSATIPKKNYSDYSKAYPESCHKVRTRGGVKVPFPLKLFKMLDSIDRCSPELSQFISWQPHGRCFRVHDLQKFREHVLPKFFNHTQYTSFRRQLNLWGFTRLRGKGDDQGAYYHEMFLRGKPFLCHGIIRTPIVGAGKSSSQAPGTKRSTKAEPKFCSMPPMPPRAEVITNLNEPEVHVESDNANGAGDIEMDNSDQSIAAACNNDLLSLAGRTLNSQHFEDAFESLLQDPPSSLLLPVLPTITLEMLEVRPATASPMHQEQVGFGLSSSSCDSLTLEEDSTEEDSIMNYQDPCHDSTSDDTPEEDPTINYQDPCNDDNIAWGRDDNAFSSSLYTNLTPFVGDPPPITQDEWEQIRDLVSRIK